MKCSLCGKVDERVVVTIVVDTPDSHDEEHAHRECLAALLHELGRVVADREAAHSARIEAEFLDQYRPKRARVP